MPFWKVRPGATFAHAGATQKGGAILELPRRLAEEFPHALDECTSGGTLLPKATPYWAAALETIPAHEAVDVLTGERRRLEAIVAELICQAEEAIADVDVKKAALAEAQQSLRALDARIDDEIAAAKKLLEERLATESAAASKSAPAEKKKAAATAG